MNRQDRRVLVTGASGFIGRHTLAGLRARGYEVHAVARIDTVKEAHGCSWHRADLLDPKQRKALLEETAPSHLLHLAWYAVPGKFWSAPENQSWLRASQDLLALFLAGGGHRFVGAGTCAEYDWAMEGVHSESEVACPATEYGRAKTAFRQDVENSGCSQAWGRIFFPYGLHEPIERLIPTIIRSLLAGRPVPLSHGNQVRDFLFVEDLGDAFAALLDSPAQGPVNLASGNGHRIREVAEFIQGRLGGELQFGVRTAPIPEPDSLVASVERLDLEIGWRPRMDLFQGLERTIEWWKREQARAIGS